jgi:hypothetical protein
VAFPCSVAPVWLQNSNKTYSRLCKVYLFLKQCRKNLWKFNKKMKKISESISIQKKNLPNFLWTGNKNIWNQKTLWEFSSLLKECLLFRHDEVGERLRYWQHRVPSSSHGFFYSPPLAVFRCESIGRCVPSRGNPVFTQVLKDFSITSMMNNFHSKFANVKHEFPGNIIWTYGAVIRLSSTTISHLTWRA